MPRDLSTYNPRRCRSPTGSFASTIQVSISDEMVFSVRSMSVCPGVRLVNMAVMSAVFR